MRKQASQPYWYSQVEEQNKHATEQWFCAFQQNWDQINGPCKLNGTSTCRGQAITVFERNEVRIYIVYSLAYTKHMLTCIGIVYWLSI